MSRYQTLKFAIVGFLGSLLIRLLICTLRVRTIGEEHEPKNRGLIYCFWHSQLLPLAYLYRNRKIHIMVSSHRDGEYIARAAAWFGLGAVRGSSTRGGARALSGAIAKLAEGVDIAITPDGPRGPAHEFKPGAAFLAGTSGAPIILAACVPRKAWRLKSWDRFYIPKPFSRLMIIKSKPIYLPKDMADEEFEQQRLNLQEQLNALTREAEEMLGRT